MLEIVIVNAVTLAMIVVLVVVVVVVVVVAGTFYKSPVTCRPRLFWRIFVLFGIYIERLGISRRPLLMFRKYL